MDKREDMKEKSKGFEPSAIEYKWSQFWEENKLFQADAQSDKTPYCVMLPPPNVTGVLHMGHALVDTLQDVMIRFKRMSGFETLWVPGVDHAGISTQTVVERHLIQTIGKRRIDFSREEFLKHVWAWKEENEKKIVGQIKLLGCSLDWSRMRFTMDQDANLAVKTVFKKMFDDGLIYRGDYLVNWDTITQTALADDEVEYEEKDSFLWHFKYPIKDMADTFIEIATTRPETFLGDTAVAVSPSDERYQNLIGKLILHPFTGREIPIIADHFVKKEFGTGAVKITPAHDPNDYEMGLRHDLPMINMMTPDGKVNEVGLEFEGLSMKEARAAIVSKMKELGFLVRTVPHKHRVGISYRSKAIIEPYLSKQWFVNISSFKQELIDAVKQKYIKLIPSNWESTYFHWIENLRDWCISRQLWWGHRIPIWYNKKDPSKVICHVEDSIPDEVSTNPNKWVQEEDVLDTWFSSALWPFSALGYPSDSEDIKKFYPNATLITGHDILFFWVARMIFMGKYVMGEFPFKETFLHGLIYGKSYWRESSDGHIAYVNKEEKRQFDLGEKLPKDIHSKWEKMSKSKGNVIDPIEMLQTYGADALRTALCSNATHAKQIDLDLRKFEEQRNFMNKIWNASRFIFMHLDSEESPLTPTAFARGLDMSCLQIEDKWILSRLQTTIQEVSSYLENYQFDFASSSIYRFFWDEFCAYYLELAKPVLFGKVGKENQRANKQKILASILTATTCLLHPFAPFITEEIFSELKKGLSGKTSQCSLTKKTLKALSAKACAVAPFPKADSSFINEASEKDFAFLSKIIHSVRNIRSEMKIPLSFKIDLFLVCKKDNFAKLLKENAHVLPALLKINKIEFVDSEPAISSSSSMIETVKIIIPLPVELKEKEKTRLSKESEHVKNQISSIEGRLSNKAFVEKAPTALVEKTTQELDTLKCKLSDMEQKLKSL